MSEKVNWFMGAQVRGLNVSQSSTIDVDAYDKYELDVLPKTTVYVTPPSSIDKIHLILVSSTRYDKFLNLILFQDAENPNIATKTIKLECPLMLMGASLDGPLNQLLYQTFKFGFQNTNPDDTAFISILIGRNQ